MTDGIDNVSCLLFTTCLQVVHQTSCQSLSKVILGLIVLCVLSLCLGKLRLPEFRLFNFVHSEFYLRIDMIEEFRLVNSDSLDFILEE